MPAVEIIATMSVVSDGLWDPGVELQDGDALLWFYRADSSAAAPSGRMASLCNDFGEAITFAYEPHRDWGALDSTHYVAYIDGTLTFNGAGDVTVDDKIYAIFDQFTGFVSGDHVIKFTLPGVDRANVEAAHILRGVTPTAPGRYIQHTEPTPDYKMTYGSSVLYTGFPASVSLTANSSIVYGLYSMIGSVQPPAGYISVEGTTVKSYIYTDPTDSPTTMTKSLIAYIDDLSGVGTAIDTPFTGGWSGIGISTGYTMDVLVINGTEAPVPVVPPTVYFVDVIVFNGSASKPPTEF